VVAFLGRCGMIIAGIGPGKSRILIETLPISRLGSPVEHVVRLHINGISLQTACDTPEAGRNLVIRLANDLGIQIRTEDGS
jgi:hypothetical protein